MPLSPALTLLLVVAACSPAGRAVISEVFYDAAGDDTGREFVELLNPGATPASLAGVRLEAGDGAGAGRWTLRWTGGVGDTIPAGGRFLVGGALVESNVDALATLDLQNGPDAVRLVWPDGAIEVVGYGALAFPEYFCGAPAPDVAAGQSLAREPDDSDRGSNALDFSPAEPSPGRANQVTRDAALRRGSLTLDPAQPAEGEASRLSGTLINRGLSPWSAGAVMLEAGVEGGALSSLAAPALAAAESARVTLDLPAIAPGSHRVVMRASLVADERPANDADSLHVRTGPGPLAITEIQFHPAHAEGEWVELRSREAAPVALGAFTFSDRSGVEAALPPDSPDLEPESLAVLVQDRAAWLLHYPALDPSRVVEVAPWPALNNSDDADGIADAVAIRERDGTPCDRVEYSAHGIPAGVPIELGGAGWGVDSEPDGTPLAGPRMLPPLAARFAITPRRVRTGHRPMAAWSLPWSRAWLSIEVFDLAGRLVARQDEEAVLARGERRLDELPGPGLYRVALRARPMSGPGLIHETCIVRIEGVEP